MFNLKFTPFYAIDPGAGGGGGTKITGRTYLTDVRKWVTNYGVGLDEPGALGMKDAEGQDTETPSDAPAGPSVTDHSVIEHLKKYIEGTLEVIPTYLNYKPGEIIELKGLGSQFSGRYYTTKTRVTLDTSGEVRVALELLRVNLEPDQPPASKSSGVYASDLPSPKQQQEQSRPSREVVQIEPQKRTHTVAPGDTLSKIAQIYYGDWSKWTVIWEANREMLIARDARNETNPGHWIYPGQVLVIP